MFRGKPLHLRRRYICSSPTRLVASLPLWFVKNRSSCRKDCTRRSRTFRLAGMLGGPSYTAGFWWDGGVGRGLRSLREGGGASSLQPVLFRKQLDLTSCLRPSFSGVPGGSASRSS